MSDTPAPAATAHRRASSAPARPSSRGFIALLEAFRPSGGLLPGDLLGRLLQEAQRGDIVSLARLLVAGQVFGFAWRGSFWLPMFQFDPHDLSLRPEPRAVRAALSALPSDWAVATWFATAHPALAGQRPVDRLQAALAPGAGADPTPARAAARSAAAVGPAADPAADLAAVLAAARSTSAPAVDPSAQADPAWHGARPTRPAASVRQGPRAMPGPGQTGHAGQTGRPAARA